MEGVSITDIAPNDEQLKGLPLRIVTRLVKEYPKIVSVLAGGGLSAEAIVEQGPDAVEMIIAAGWGKAGDKAAMEKAGNLELPEQIRLVSEIIAKTLGGGAGPFSELLRNLYAPFQVPKAATEDREAKIAIIRERLAKLQRKSSSTSKPTADSPQEKYGT